MRRESVAGSKEHEDVNKVSKDGGVDYRGMGSAETRTLFESLGFSKENAQDITGAGGYAVDSVSKLAGQWLTIRPAVMGKGAAATGGGAAAGGGITQEKLDAANRHVERLVADQ